METQRYGVLKNDDFISLRLIDEEDNSRISFNFFVLVEQLYIHNGNGEFKVTFLDGDNRLLSLKKENWALNPDAKMVSDWGGYYFFFEFIDPKGNKKELRSCREGLTIFKHHGVFDEELKFAFTKLEELSIYPDWGYPESLERIKELEVEITVLKAEIESLKKQIEIQSK